ncbi:hypothetical protein [Vibrio alfacsensis]|nr:hypothetical protein [Vibrio alfacsensis]
MALVTNAQAFTEYKDIIEKVWSAWLCFLESIDIVTTVYKE